MADSSDFQRTTTSPLFDKMDALLARHRGANGAPGIPVLMEEAIEESTIPVLTDIVQEDELMFDMGDSRPAPPPTFPPPSLTPPPSDPDDAFFLDLPLFDLDDSIEPTPNKQDDSLPPRALLSAEEEAALQFPSIGFIPVPATILPLDGLPALGVPDIAFPETIDAEEHIEIAVVAEEWLAPEDIEIAQPVDSADWADTLSLTEPLLPFGEMLTLDAEPEPEPPGLSEAAISEITASVAAQIAVEVSTEVSQLTRQHFANMMNTFYGESLRKLTDEISRDMEMCLAPRIEELVRIELQRQGKMK